MSRRPPNPPNQNPPPPDISDVVGAGTNSPGNSHSDSDGEDYAPQQQQQHPRRDVENSISFRHFLQQPSDLVPIPIRHRSNRNAGSGNGAGVDLFDIHMGLPDFVQDHLVNEGSGNNNLDPEQALDLSALADCIPISSHNRNQFPERGHSQQPFPNLEELGACGGVGTGCINSGNNWNPLLPDFLSDGPMHCDRDASNTNSATLGSSDNDVVESLSNSTSRHRSDFSHMPLRSSSLDVDPHHVERMRRELLDKTRRITELENSVVQQEREINNLQNTVEELMRRLESQNPAPAQIQNGPEADDPARQSRANGDSRILPIRQNGLPPENAPRFHQEVRNAELLARELAGQLQRIRRIAESSERDQQQTENENGDSESAPPQQKPNSDANSSASEKN